MFPGFHLLFQGGETKSVAFSFTGLTAENGPGGPEFHRITQAVRRVVGDHGWLDVELELGRR